MAQSGSMLKLRATNQHNNAKGTAAANNAYYQNNQPQDGTAGHHQAVKQKVFSLPRDVNGITQITTPLQRLQNAANSE